MATLLSGAVADQQDSELAAQVDRLVRQLNDEQLEYRDAAEAALQELAPQDGFEEIDAFLRLLPPPIEGMPAEVEERLTRLRRELETRQAANLIQGSRVSISADGMDLAAEADFAVDLYHRDASVELLA